MRILNNDTSASSVGPEIIVQCCDFIVLIVYVTCLYLIAFPELPFTVIWCSKHIVKDLWELQSEGFFTVAGFQCVIEIMNHSGISIDSFRWNATPTENYIRHIFLRSVGLNPLSDAFAIPRALLCLPHKLLNFFLFLCYQWVAVIFWPLFVECFDNIDLKSIHPLLVFLH